MVDCLYSVLIITCVHKKRHEPALRLQIRPPTSGPTYCIVPFIVSWPNIIICYRTCILCHHTIIISKLDLEKLHSIFCRFSVNVCSVLCRFFVHFYRYFLVDCRYFVPIMSVLSRVFTGSSTSPLCASGFGHPQVVLLIVSSHLLNVPFIVSWLNIVICYRTCTEINDTIIISKLDLEKLLSVFCRFSVDVCSVLCRFFVYFLSLFAWFSVDILSVLSRVFTGSSTSPLCASRFGHPQVVLLIVSSHLLNVPFIVSWRNIIICYRTCIVIRKTMVISKLDLEKLLSVFCRFQSMVARFFVDSSSIFCRLMFGWLSIFGPYYYVCS